MPISQKSPENPGGHKQEEKAAEPSASIHVPPFWQGEPFVRQSPLLRWQFSPEKPGGQTHRYRPSPVSMQVALIAQGLDEHKRISWSHRLPTQPSSQIHCHAFSHVPCRQPGKGTQWSQLSPCHPGLHLHFPGFSQNPFSVLHPALHSQPLTMFVTERIKTTAVRCIVISRKTPFVLNRMRLCRPVVLLPSDFDHISQVCFFLLSFL